MSSGSGMKFSAGMNQISCRGVDSGLAVLAKPTFSPKSAQTGADESINDGIGANVVEALLSDPSGFLPSAGPPHEIHSTNRKTLVLRI
jgi:hypothetical protein